MATTSTTTSTSSTNINNNNNNVDGDNNDSIVVVTDDSTTSPSVPVVWTAWTKETADWYATNFGDAVTNRMTVDYLLEQEFLTICQSMVVDVGCGTGTALRYIAEQLPTSRMTLMGVDATPRMIQIAREQTRITCPTGDVGRIQWRLAFAEDMPLADNSADVMLVLDVLDHVSDLEKVFQELHRVLKPDGTLVIGKDASLGEDSNTDLHLQCAKNQKGLVIHSHRKLVEDNVTLNLVLVKKKKQ
jgi:SAM-dependent methyltransferase